MGLIVFFETINNNCAKRLRSENEKCVVSEVKNTLFCVNSLKNRFYADQ